MSFLKKMFGGKSHDERMQDAERLFAEQRYGEAKLEFERALAAKGQTVLSTERAALRVVECCNAIANARLVQAKKHIREGERELAEAELDGATEVAHDPAILLECQNLRDALVVRKATETVEATSEITDEDKLALIEGGWEEEQAEEYDRYDERLTKGLMCLLRGEFKEAHELLAALEQTAKQPAYLWLEIARCRLMSEDKTGGIEALKTFLSRIGPDEGGNARLSAHLELARLHDEEGRHEEALAEYENAVESMPEDPRPYIVLGRYLRTRGVPTEAVEVMRAALPVMGELRPEWRVLEELGLALKDAGETAEAIERLESVIGIFMAQRQVDFPPETARALAELSEKNGRLERAADLYRHLAEGSNREAQLDYLLEAARLLDALNLPGERRKILLKAQAAAVQRGATEIAEKMATELARL